MRDRPKLPSFLAVRFCKAALRAALRPGHGTPALLTRFRPGTGARTMNVHHTPEHAREKPDKAKEMPLQPAQAQDHQPGVESRMRPRPDYTPKYPGVGKLRDKVAVITGGDSGIGRAVAVAMAREGALISIVYLEEHDDARETVRLVEAEGSQAILFAGDVADEM